MTKSISPADQFVQMRDIINGPNPVVFVSSKVRELCDVTSVSAVSILSIDGLDGEISDISWCFSTDILEIELDCNLNGSKTDILEIELDCDLNGSNVEIEFVGIL